MVPFWPFLVALGIAQTFGLALLSLAQEVVQILVIGIECRLVHNPVAELTLESGEGRTSGHVIVKIALNQGVVGKYRESLCNVGDRVEYYSVETVIIAEPFSGKEVYEAFKHIASRIPIGNMRDMLGRV